MARSVDNAHIIQLRGSLWQDYRQVWMMAISATVLSAAIIIYYNHKMYYEQIANAYTTVEIAAITLMPYMVSAVIATITTIGIMSALPMVRSGRASRYVHDRVRKMSDGDLTTASRLDCSNPYLKDIASELNVAIGFVGSSMAQWKIINRQQWDLLENIRRSTLKGNPHQALKLIDKMEDNWKLIAEIEDRFRT